MILDQIVVLRKKTWSKIERKGKQQKNVSWGGKIVVGKLRKDHHDE